MLGESRNELYTPIVITTQISSSKQKTATPSPISAMKTFTVPIILALLTFAALVSVGTDFENAAKCGKRFPRINQAIEIFCGKSKDNKLTNDLVVPSKYADQGVGITGYEGNKILVAIKGNCEPAQWVPYNWCNAQFHDLCANSEHGYAWRAHGKNGCQKFVIGTRMDEAKTRSSRGPFNMVGEEHGAWDDYGAAFAKFGVLVGNGVDLEKAITRTA
jgi:hypothetical protein